MADEVTIKSETEIKDLENLVLLLEKKSVLDKEDIDNLNNKRDVVSNLSGITNNYKDVLNNLDQRINNLNSSYKSLNVAVSEVDNSTDSVVKSFTLFNDVTSSASYYLNQLTGSFESVENQLSKYNNLTKEQANLAALSIAAITGIESRFNNLKFDTGNLNLLRDDINGFVKTLNESNLGSGIDFVNKLFGGSAPDEIKGKIEKALASGAGAAVDVVKGIISDYTNASDNVQKLSAAFYQMSAASGNLSDVQNAAGENFKNLNLLIANQSKAMDDLSIMYGIQDGNVERYYSSIGKLPGALQDTVKGYDDSVSRLSLFQAALLQSEGSGRAFEDVINDMHSAIRTYGVDNQEALNFTARMTELSKNYKIELKDVQEYLLSTGQTFKFFGNQIEGSSRLFNTYFDAFQQTGLSKASSVELIKNMTSGIEGLTIAQKAFLSSQTGGRGGLAGAFEIEKELRDGNIDKVFERVRETLKKQMGEIVTLEEASQSQDAAARLTKQISLVKEGPLGRFAQTDQQAMRLLEGFKSEEKGDSVIKDLQLDPSLDLMKQGNELLQRNNNVASQTLDAIKGIRNLAEKPIADMVGGALTSGQFYEDEGVEKFNLREAQNRLLKQRQLQSTEETADFNKQLKGEEPVKDVLGRKIIENVELTKNVVSNTIDSGKVVIEQMKEFNPGIPSSPENVFNEELRNRNKEINNQDNNQLINVSKEIGNSNNNELNNIIKPIQLNESGNDFNTSLIINKEIKDNIKPAYNEEVQKSLQSQQTQINNNNNTYNNTTNNNSNVSQEPSIGKVHVEVSGYCIDCGTKMNGRSHLGVITPVR